MAATQLTGRNILDSSLEINTETNGLLSIARGGTGASNAADARTALGITSGSAVPQCRVYNSTDIVIAGGTLQALTFNSERFDVDSMHSTATNTGRITINTAGCYLLSAHVTWTATNIGARRYAAIRLNGTTTIAANEQTPGNASAIHSISTVYRLAVGDYAEVVVMTNSVNGSPNVIATANYSPEFCAVMLSI